MALTEEQKKALNNDPRFQTLIKKTSPTEDATPKSIEQQIAARRERRVKKVAAEAPVEEVEPIEDRTLGQKIGSGLSKFADVTESVLEKPSNLLFGTVSEAVGKTIIGGAESAAELIEGGAIPKEERLGFDVAEGGDVASKGEIAFSALETLPGGGQFTKGLGKLIRKVPGGGQVAEMVLEQMSKIAPALREQAAEQFTRLLRPTTIRSKAITQKVAPGLAERKITTATKKGLLNKAQASLKEVGSQFDEVLKNIPEDQVIDTAPIVKALEKAKGEFRVTSAGKVIDVDPNAIARIEDLQAVIGEFGSKVEFKSLRNLRQIWDKAIDASNGFTKTLSEGTLIDIKKKGTNAIREELAKSSPELAKVNAEFSFWKGVEEVIGKEVQAGKGRVGLIEKGATGLAATAGFKVSGLEGAVIAGAAAKNFVKLTNSAIWRTMSAKNKTMLANAIENGAADPIKLENTLRRLLVLTNNTFEE